MLLRPFNTVVISGAGARGPAATHATAPIDGMDTDNPYLYYDAVSGEVRQYIRLADGTYHGGMVVAQVEPGTPPEEIDPELHAIGMNTGVASYYDWAYMLVDFSYGETEFVKAGADWAPAICDALGNPLEDFRMKMMTPLNPAGVYKLRFKGQATIEATGLANQYYDSGTNTTTADVVFATDIPQLEVVKFTATKPTSGATAGTGVTDVHLYRPGYPTDGSKFWTDEYIQAMKKVHILRTMDMQFTNGNDASVWADRTLPEFIGRPGARGMAYEHLVRLANDCDRDLWIHVPAKADEDHMTKLAQLINFGSNGVDPYTSVQGAPAYAPLKQSLKIYVELGNEIWNSSGGFYNMGWIKAESDAAWVDAEHPFKPFNPSETDQWSVFKQYIAYKSSRVSTKFKEVFGAPAMMTRVRPILGTQIGNANGYASVGIAWAIEKLGGVKDIWWGGGGASYFESASEPADLDPATMQAYFDGLPGINYASRIAADSLLFVTNGMRNINYEGGPQPGGSALGGTTGIAEAVINAYNADPRMGIAIVNAWDAFIANGGHTFVYYGYSGMGAPWRFVDITKNPTTSDNTSPKLLALDSIRTRPLPEVTFGIEMPATIAAVPGSTPNIHREGVSVDGTGADARWRFRRYEGGNGEYFSPSILSIALRFPVAGEFKVKFTIYTSKPNIEMELAVGDVVIGTHITTNISSGGYTDSAYFNFSAAAGITGIRLRAKNAPSSGTDTTVNIRSITIEAA